MSEPIFPAILAAVNEVFQSAAQRRPDGLTSREPNPPRVASGFVFHHTLARMPANLNLPRLLHRPAITLRSDHGRFLKLGSLAATNVSAVK